MYLSGLRIGGSSSLFSFPMSLYFYLVMVRFICDPNSPFIITNNVKQFPANSNGVPL